MLIKEKFDTMINYYSIKKTKNIWLDLFRNITGFKANSKEEIISKLILLSDHDFRNKSRNIDSQLTELLYELYIQKKFNNNFSKDIISKDLKNRYNCVLKKNRILKLKSIHSFIPNYLNAIKELKRVNHDLDVLYQAVLSVIIR